MSASVAMPLALVVLGGLAVGAGGLVVTAVFRQVDRTGTSPGTGASGSVEAASRILRGGAWIGALERLAIYSTVVAGWPEGLAVVLAVKGLARYPELQAGKASAAAERFIIGTFVSTLFACACAGLAQWARAALA